MAKSLEEIKANLHQDIKNANSKEIAKIHTALKEATKAFDKDSALKNLYDFFQ